MNKHLIALLILTFFMFNCSTSDNPSEDSQNCTTSFPFLEEGKTLKYNFSFFGGNATESVIKIKQCDGDGFLVDRTMYDITTGKTETITDLWKQDGDFLLTDSANNKDYWSKIYKKNAVLGDKWSFENTNAKIITHEVIAVDSLITVPAGTFKCTVYKYTTSTTVNETFVSWNDEIGNIKEDGEGFFLLELKSYE